MVISIETTLVFATLLYLVAIELTDKIEAQSMINSITDDRPNVWGWFPNLGKFTFIHVICSFLLMTGYFIVFTNWMTNDSVAISLILLSTACLLGLLPYLEISEFGTLSNNSEGILNSKNVHFSFTIFVVFIEPPLFILAGVFTDVLDIPWMNIIVASLFTVVFLISMMKFLECVRAELEHRS